MKTKGLLYTLIIFGGLSMVSWVLYPTGSPGGKTGSPGDGTNCTECHAGTANQATGWLTSNIPASGYLPGQVYQVTASGMHTGVVKFGFEVTSEDAANAKKGTIAITDAVQTQLANGGNSITHTVNGTAPSGDTKSWMFDWTAPASGSGVITFYGAFNAANGNGNNTGDVIYLCSYSVSEASSGLADNLPGSGEILLSPNPFQDHLDLTFLNLGKNITAIRVTGQDGRIVWTNNVLEDQPEKLRIETSGFSRGIYFVTVQFSDNTQFSGKVIKSR